MCDARGPVLPRRLSRRCTPDGIRLQYYSCKPASCARRRHRAVQGCNRFKSSQAGTGRGRGAHNCRRTAGRPGARPRDPCRSVGRAGSGPGVGPPVWSVPGTAGRRGGVPWPRAAGECPSGPPPAASCSCAPPGSEAPALARALRCVWGSGHTARRRASASARCAVQATKEGGGDGRDRGHSRTRKATILSARLCTKSS